MLVFISAHKVDRPQYNTKPDEPGEFWSDLEGSRIFLSPGANFRWKEVAGQLVGDGIHSFIFVADLSFLGTGARIASFAGIPDIDSNFLEVF